MRAHCGKLAPSLGEGLRLKKKFGHKAMDLVPLFCSYLFNLRRGSLVLDGI